MDDGPCIWGNLKSSSTKAALPNPPTPKEGPAITPKLRQFDAPGHSKETSVSQAALGKSLSENLLILLELGFDLHLARRTVVTDEVLLGLALHLSE